MKTNEYIVNIDHVFADTQLDGGVFASEYLRVVLKGAKALGDPTEAKGEGLVSTEGGVAAGQSHRAAPLGIAVNVFTDGYPTTSADRPQGEIAHGDFARRLFGQAFEWRCLYHPIQ